EIVNALAATAAQSSNKSVVGIAIAPGHAAAMADAACADVPAPVSTTGIAECRNLETTETRSKVVGHSRGCRRISLRVSVPASSLEELGKEGLGKESVIR